MKFFLTTLAATLCLAVHGPAMAKDYDHYAPKCEPIRQDVEAILDRVGVSRDYFFLLVAESHCDPHTSPAGAVGYWQMLPATAREHGCGDPFDLECETYAAAYYLQHLEMKCGHDDVVYCWHDGGSNFLRRGRVPTKAARGLYWAFRHFLRTGAR